MGIFSDPIPKKLTSKLWWSFVAELSKLDEGGRVQACAMLKEASVDWPSSYNGARQSLIRQKDTQEPVRMLPKEWLADAVYDPFVPLADTAFFNAGDITDFIELIRQDASRLHLTVLCLNYGKIVDADLSVVVSHLENPRDLQLLSLPGNRCSFEPLQPCTGLRHVNFERNVACRASLPILTSFSETLEGLQLSNVGLVDDELAAVAGGFARLKDLVLGGNPVSAKALMAFLRNNDMPNLETLALWDTGMDASVLEFLASERLAIKRLYLGGMPLGVEAMNALKDLSLEVLDLSRSGLEDGIVASWLRSPAVATLKQLSLHGNPLGPLTVKAIMESEFLGRLTSLQVSGFSEEDVQQLRTVKSIRDLTIC